MSALIWRQLKKPTKEDTRNTIIIALILLLIGSSAIVSLFLAQAYRLAHTSLSRITIFSETLVKNMPIGLIATDENGNITTCNEKAGAILKMACNEVEGKQTNCDYACTSARYIGRTARSQWSCGKRRAAYFRTK